MRTVGVVCLLLLAAGCGGPDYRGIQEKAEQDVAEARIKFGEGAFQESFDLLTNAIQCGGLSREQLYLAAVQRVLAATELKDAASAESDLVMMEEVAPDQAQYLALRSYVRGKQGKRAQAEADFRSARALDRGVSRFTP